MRTFYSLTKRQFLGMIKFNKFLYGNSKEKKVFAYTFFAIGLTVIILSFCWFRMVFQICMTFQYPQEIFKYLLKLDIENPIIRINTAFKGCSSLEKISVLPRIYHN